MHGAERERLAVERERTLGARARELDGSLRGASLAGSARGRLGRGCGRGSCLRVRLAFEPEQLSEPRVDGRQVCAHLRARRRVAHLVGRSDRAVVHLPALGREIGQRELVVRRGLLERAQPRERRAAPHEQAQLARARALPELLVGERDLRGGVRIEGGRGCSKVQRGTRCERRAGAGMLRRALCAHLRWTFPTERARARASHLRPRRAARPAAACRPRGWRGRRGRCRPPAPGSCPGTARAPPSRS